MSVTLLDYEDATGDLLRIYTSDAVDQGEDLIVVIGEHSEEGGPTRKVAVSISLTILRDSLFPPIPDDDALVGAVADVLASYAMSHTTHEKIEWRGMASAIAEAGLLRSTS